MSGGIDPDLSVRRPETVAWAERDLLDDDKVYVWGIEITEGMSWADLIAERNRREDEARGRLVGPLTRLFRRVTRTGLATLS